MRKYDYYRCKNNHYFVSRDEDEGFKPSRIVCPGCHNKMPENVEDVVFAISAMYNLPQNIKFHCDFVWRKHDGAAMLSAGDVERVGNGGLLKYAGDPAPDSRLKKSWTLLPQDIIALRPPEPLVHTYDQLIILAKGGIFDDYSFDLRIPDNWNWTCPKVALVGLLKTLPGLASIAKMAIDGKYDDLASPEDEERFRSELPPDLLKAIGL